jgi:hypothetical protein
VLLIVSQARTAPSQPLPACRGKSYLTGWLLPARFHWRALNIDCLAALHLV